MKSKYKRLIYPAVAVIFWLAVWEIAALIIGEEIILPRVIPTISALFSIIIGEKFLLTVLLTLLRITLGFVIGLIIGVLFAILAYRSELIKTIISPAMTVVKSAPVASFIMLLWILTGSDTVPTLISLLMVLPIIYQNTLAGLSSLNRELIEVCQVFELPRQKKFEFLYYPSLVKFVIPAVITSSSLAWKAGVAAEIIAYTASSIGREIYFAKANFEIKEMFAWTFVVIAISLLLELGIKRAFRRFLK